MIAIPICGADGFAGKGVFDGKKQPARILDDLKAGVGAAPATTACNRQVMASCHAVALRGGNPATVQRVDEKKAGTRSRLFSFR